MEHNVIPDSLRHETKGASTAAAGLLHRANGDGTTNWSALSYGDLIGRPVAQGYLPVLHAFSLAASQLPTALGVALQVEFGAAQTTADVLISAAGLVTFVTAGQYVISKTLRLGRATLTGAAIIGIRTKINGLQYNQATSFSLNDSNEALPYSSTFIYTAAAGDTMTVEIIRDPAVINVGGLYQWVMTASGWGSCPTASLSIAKFKGLV